MRKELIALWAHKPAILSTRYLESFHTGKSYCAHLVSEYTPLILNIRGHCNVLSSNIYFSSLKPHFFYVYGDMKSVSFQSNTSPNTFNWTVTDVKTEDFHSWLSKTFCNVFAKTPICMTLHCTEMLCDSICHHHPFLAYSWLKNCPWCGPAFPVRGNSFSPSSAQMLFVVTIVTC